MASEFDIFAGVDISSGRKPITFATLDKQLEIGTLSQWDVAEWIDCLKEYESVQLTINAPHSKSGQLIFADLQHQIEQEGFKHYSLKNSSRLWLGSSAEECFRVFQAELLPSRTLEGRIQRGLILFDEGLQVKDAMDFLEEITRHKLMQGVLPTESIYSSRQLAAMVLAYVSWMAGSPSEKVLIKGDLYLPAPG